MDFGGSLGEVWRQGKIPVVLRRTGPGERLRLRIPLDISPGYSWLEKLGRHHPMWSGAPTYYWEVPKSWFDDFVDAALRSFGKVYIIQPTGSVKSVPTIAVMRKGMNVSARAWVQTMDRNTTRAGSTSRRPLPSKLASGNWPAACYRPSRSDEETIPRGPRPQLRGDL